MSFNEFVDDHGKALWRAAFLLTGDHHKAEDLVQTALTKAYGRYAGNDAEFGAYVRTTIYHTYISWWRRRWNAEYPTEQLPERPVERGDAPLRLDVLRALATLPKMQRAVLVLRYFEDRPVTEVARLLGISEGTVKSHTHRGCEALRSSSHLKENKEANA